MNDKFKNVLDFVSSLERGTLSDEQQAILLAGTGEPATSDNFQCNNCGNCQGSNTQCNNC